MQTNRIFNKRFNKSNVKMVNGYNTLIGVTTKITFTGTYENIDLKIKETLENLETDGFRFYKNKINNLELDGTGEIKNAKTQFIKIKAQELPINITGNVITIGFEDTELTKYKTILDNYNIQGWGIEIPKNVYQLNEELIKGTNKTLKLRIFNSTYNKGSIKVDILPEVYIFEE